MSKLKLLELFSGIQAQERALRQLPIEYESVGVCDCDKDVLVSAVAMRFNLEEEIKNFNFPSQDKMIEYLQNKNIGYSFEKNKHTITSRTPIAKLKQYYIADNLLKNLGDISKVDRLPYADLVTYSSPCQSFSVAGKLAGAKKICKACGHEWEIDFSTPNYNYKCPHCGSVNLESTTSGLLQEVQRLLSVAYENNELPKYLLLENVKNLVGKKFKPQFDAWIRWLDSIGYNTYYQVLNSKNFGIPQNRERIFALSIRKDVDNGKFKFPEQIPLTTRLKDILEKTVDEKYYLSGDKVESILANFIARQNEASGINLKDQATTFDGLTDVAHTLMARDYKGFGNQSMTGVIEPIIVASRGRNPENPSDRTTGSPTEQRLEANTNGTTNTITTVAKDNYVMEPQVLRAERTEYGKEIRKKYESGEVHEKIGNMREMMPRTDGVSNTITTVQKDNYVIEPQIIQKFGDRGTNQYSIRDYAHTIPANPMSDRGQMVMEPVVCEQRCDEGLRFFKDDVVGTLRTIDACGDKRVIEPELQFVGGIGNKDWAKDGKQLSRNYPQGNRVYSADGIATSLTAQGVGSHGGASGLYAVDEDINPVRIGNIYGEQFGTGYAGNVWDQDAVSPTIMTAQGGNRQPLVVDNVKWRIRKLTPLECWRLMGFSDEDCNRASKYVSDSALYKQAGNSIVTSCLVAIFYSLLFNDISTKWSDYIVQYKINGGN